MLYGGVQSEVQYNMVASVSQSVILLRCNTGSRYMYSVRLTVVERSYPPSHIFQLRKNSTDFVEISYRVSSLKIDQI